MAGSWYSGITQCDKEARHRALSLQDDKLSCLLHISFLLVTVRTVWNALYRKLLPSWVERPSSQLDKEIWTGFLYTDGIRSHAQCWVCGKRNRAPINFQRKLHRSNLRRKRKFRARKWRSFCYNTIYRLLKTLVFHNIYRRIAGHRRG